MSQTTTTQITVGVLSLQGDFAAHASKLSELGCNAIEVRSSADLEQIRGIVIPGGESTTMLKLLDRNLATQLLKMIRGGFPVLATCAGVILLAKHVRRPEQESLDALDIDVERNAYGRQLQSSIASQLEITAEGKKTFTASQHSIEGVFIRAPRITRTGQDTQTLLTSKGDPVLVRKHNILAATFHPELSPGFSPVHQLFLNFISNNH